MKKRIPVYDLMRSVAIALVVLQHCWSILDLDVPCQCLSYQGYRALIYGIPLFVMLSGFFQLSSGTGPVGPYLKKRFSRILIPFFFWMVIVYVISAVTHKYDEIHSLRDAITLFVPFFITNRINVAFWYIFMLAGLYLITPVLQRAFSSPDRKQVLSYCLVLWAASVVMSDFLPQFELVKQFPIAGRYLGYYLAGFYICSCWNEISVNKWVVALVLVASCALNVICMYAGHVFVTLEVIEVVAAFLLLRSVNLREEGLFTRMVTRMGRYSYTIYLTHFIFIRIFYSFFPSLFPLHWATPIYTTILVLLCEYLFCRVLEKLPFVPDKLTGIS